MVEGNDEPAIQVKVKEGEIDLTARVKVECNATAPHHKEGEISMMSPMLAEKFVANGWGKIVKMVLLLMALSIGATAQYQKLAKVVSNMPTTATKLIYADTVTNTATNFVTTGYPQQTVPTTASATPVALTAPAYTCTVQANLVKISGTVAGTVTLQGSLDGVTYKAVTATATGTQTGAFTATDVATQSTVWTLVNSPFRYYRISWTGTGTMAATLAGVIWVH